VAVEVEVAVAVTVFVASAEVVDGELKLANGLVLSNFCSTGADGSIFKNGLEFE